MTTPMKKFWGDLIAAILLAGGIFALLLVLSSCVASQFHQDGPADLSVYAANRDCIWDFGRVPPPAPNVQAVRSFGLIGSLASFSMPEEIQRQQIAQQIYNLCMRSHGWALN